MTPGTKLGPYEILAPVGAGGMGEVYRARDSRLGREVAIKVLPAHLVEDPQALSRFERENRAVAALSHPNILALHDVGREQGISYAVAELLEGETLRAALTRGPLAWRKAVEYGVAIAEGLSAAHSKTIIHRDLKPENIFLTTDGRVKILDFGLARFEVDAAAAPGAEEQTKTEAGMVLGTPGYMSPEQVRGGTVGPASDVFSLGCVLYEMVSGKRAFQGHTGVETISAVLMDQPRSLAESGRQAPAELDRLISHCLEKKAEQRFQSMRDLAFGLKSLLEGSGGSPRAGVSGGAAIDSIAVLPFAVAGNDPDSEYLSDGITESIINSLARIAQLRVMPRSTVFRYKGKDADPQAAGRELNARSVLSGRLIQRGDTLVVSTELIDVAEGTQLWGQRYNRKLADIFALEEEIAQKISESLRMKLTGEEKQRLVKRFTENSEAYQLYLKGRYYWTKRTPDSMKKGVEYFQRAIEQDPGYALAYSGLADCYSILSIFSEVPPRDGWAKAKAAAAAAVALDPELGEGHASLAFIKGWADWDWKASEAGLLRALELNPSYWLMHYWYAMVLGLCGRTDEAMQQIKLALDLEPLSPIIRHAAAMVMLGARRTGEAIEHCQKALEIDPDYFLARLWLGIAYKQGSRYDEAIRELERASELTGGVPMSAGPLGHAYAVVGRKDEARRLLAGFLEKTEGPPLDPYAPAVIYVGLGEQDHALEWLEKACDTHSGLLTSEIKLDPAWDALRLHPRFASVLQRMGIAR